MLPCGSSHLPHNCRSLQAPTTRSVSTSPALQPTAPAQQTTPWAWRHTSSGPCRAATRSPRSALCCAKGPIGAPAPQADAAVAAAAQRPAPSNPPPGPFLPSSSPRLSPPSPHRGPVQATVELLFEPGEPDTDTATTTPVVDVSAAADAAVNQATATANAIIDQTNAAIDAAMGTASSTAGNIDSALSGTAANLVQASACNAVCEHGGMCGCRHTLAPLPTLLRLLAAPGAAPCPRRVAPALPTCLPADAPCWLQEGLQTAQNAVDAAQAALGNLATGVRQCSCSRCRCCCCAAPRWAACLPPSHLLASLRCAVGHASDCHRHHRQLLPAPVPARLVHTLSIARCCCPLSVQY
jgi:hypothetical protein